MHPDRKIGIAMGILLVGVVGALFFRNEPLEDNASLAVQRESELNERLRERDVAVYLDADDKSDPANGEDDVHLRLEEILSKHSPTQPSVPIPVRRDSVVRPGTIDPAKPSGRPPLDFDPPRELLNPANKKSSTNRTVQVPVGRKHEVTMADAVGAGLPESRAAHKPQQEFDEYTVQFGDTLSEISERFLGSQSRYREIFEANRDRMSSPDQLRVGKAIRIPRIIR